MKHFSPGPRMSGAVLSNGTLYLSGQVADDTAASIEDQTAQVLRKIDAFLTEAGLTCAQLVMVNIYLPSIADFDAMNSVYDTWIDPASTPARATVEARLADPNLRVEISAVAETNA